MRLRSVALLAVLSQLIGCRSKETFPCGAGACSVSEVCVTTVGGMVPVAANPPGGPPMLPPPAKASTGCQTAPMRCLGRATCDCVQSNVGMCQMRAGGAYLHVALP